MALLVSDPRTENFSKPPPPKKKWIQDYFEKECEKVEFAPESVPEKKKETAVQDVIYQFQDYIQETKTKNGYRSAEHDNDEDTKNMAHLLGQDKGGLKFDNRIRELSQITPSPPTPVASPDMSKQQIGGVVQEVISQFLNGSIAEAGFRPSRKRSHRSRKHDKTSQIYLETCEVEVHEQWLTADDSAYKSIRLEDPHLLRDENGVLNLSLPKNHANRVTFAAKDDCYSTDSFRSSIASKSQEIADMDEQGHVSPISDIASVTPYVSPIGNSPPARFDVGPSRCQQQAVIYNRCLKPKPTALLVNPPGQSAFRSPHSDFLRYSPPQQLSVIMPVPVEKLMAPQSNTSSRESPVKKSKASTNVNFKSPKSFNTMPNLEPVTKPPSSNKRPAVEKPGPSAKNQASSKQKKSSPSSKAKDETKKYSCRELHNRLEKNRRALLKQCFDGLAVECELDPKKASNLTVIRSAYKYVMGLKRRERENEKELSNLVKEKIKKKALLDTLKRQMPGVLLNEDQ